MRRIFAVTAAFVMVAAFAATSANALTLNTSALTLSTASTSNTSSSNTSAGKPQPLNELFCGTVAAPTDQFSGNSSVDHPNWGTAMGQEYVYANQNCDNPGSSTGMFSWMVNHSNVNVSKDPEKGTEHGLFMESADSPYEAGFNGHVTDFDFGGGDPLACGDGRQVYYASGHAYDPCGQPSGPGNFNTHGGAATGQHYRGTYGTIVYQEDMSNSNFANSSCQSGSATYCFEAILKGQNN